MSLVPPTTGRHGRIRAGVAGLRHHGLDDVDSRHLPDQGWVRHNQLVQEPADQLTALLHAHDDDRPAAVVVSQELQEGRAHVAIGELAGLAGVVAVGEAREQAGLAIARREHPPDPLERSGVIGQHDPVELLCGPRLIERRVPVAAAVEGGGVDEEDVRRRVARAPFGRDLGDQGPGRGLGVVRRRRRRPGLKGLLRIQRGAHHVVAAQEHHDEDDGEDDSAHHHAPVQQAASGHGLTGRGRLATGKDARSRLCRPPGWRTDADSRRRAGGPSRPG